MEDMTKKEEEQLTIQQHWRILFVKIRTIMKMASSHAELPSSQGVQVEEEAKHQPHVQSQTLVLQIQEGTPPHYQEV